MFSNILDAEWISEARKQKLEIDWNDTKIEIGKSMPDI